MTETTVAGRKSQCDGQKRLTAVSFVDFDITKVSTPFSAHGIDIAGKLCYSMRGNGNSWIETGWSLFRECRSISRTLCRDVEGRSIKKVKPAFETVTPFLMPCVLSSS